MKTQKNIIVVNEFSGKYKINESYRPIAHALKKKFKELEHIPVSSIIFVENLEDKRKKNNKIIYAQISKIPGKWQDIIYQITDQSFEYMLEIFKENIWDMSREQIIALIYHELKHIQLIKDDNGPKIDIVSHDIEDWANMIEKLGVNWANTKASIPNLLNDAVDWDSITGPANLFSNETILRVVK